MGIYDRAQQISKPSVFSQRVSQATSVIPSVQQTIAPQAVPFKPKISPAQFFSALRDVITSPFKKFARVLKRETGKTSEEKAKELAVKTLAGGEGRRAQETEEEKVRLGTSLASYRDVAELAKETEEKTEKLAKFFTLPVRWTSGELVKAITSYQLEKLKFDTILTPDPENVKDKLFLTEGEIRRVTEQEDMYGMIARGVGIPATLVVMTIVENPFIKSTGIGIAFKKFLKSKVTKEGGETIIKIGAKELSDATQGIIEAGVSTGKITREEATRATEEVAKLKKSTTPGITKTADPTITGKPEPRGQKPLKKKSVTTRQVIPELTTPKASKRISDATISKGLADGIDDLPERDIIHFKEQGKLVGEIMDESPEKAIRIALGKELPTNGALPESVFTAVKNQALRKGDVDLLRRLATEEGGVATQSSILGARIKMLDEGAKDDAFSRISQLVRDRKKGFEKKGKKVVGEKKAEVKKIKEKIKKPDKHDWNAFIKSIECKV